MAEMSLKLNHYSLPEANQGVDMNEAGESFFQAEHQRLSNFIRGKLQDRGERSAEDIIQDVALKFYDSVDFQRPIENLGAYIWRSVRNRIIDIYRKPKRDEQTLDDDRSGNLHETKEASSELSDTHSQAERREVMERILSALGDLGPKYQEVWTAVELESRSYRELSEEWEIPIGTLLARKHRADGKLREKLSDLYQDYIR